jgi:formamidopyrimidine-DNA glycosylase
MPELPEVVVTLKGVLPHVQGKCISDVTVRDGRLRWPVPENLPELLSRQRLMGGRQRAT